VGAHGPELAQKKEKDKKGRKNPIGIDQKGGVKRFGRVPIIGGIQSWLNQEWQISEK